MISVIIPVHNGSQFLDQCLSAVFNSEKPCFECIVVDDTSSDGSESIYGRFPVRSVHLDGGPFGPAFARNRGAEAARGDILLFIDADVIVHTDVIGRVGELFSQRSDVDAVFGSYDESPAAGEFVSQFKNLCHHYVHQHGLEEASTFWSGCGAIKRDVFIAAGGFDPARYPRPAIEDIDLGRRLKSLGRRILLDKQLKVKHLKRWSVRGMIEADVLFRGIPWTLLILHDRIVPNDLNLQTSQRFSAILVYLIVLDLLVVSLFHNVLLVPLFAGLFLLWVGNWYWPQGVRPFRSNRRAERAAWVLLAMAGTVAFFSGGFWPLIPLLPAVLGMLLKDVFGDSALIWNRVYFGVAVMGFAWALWLAMASIPFLFAAPIWIAVAGLVLLNRGLFGFFLRQKGLIFAVAALPFQMLYYFYSVLAFLLGMVVHLRSAGVKGQPETPGTSG